MITLRAKNNSGQWRWVAFHSENENREDLYGWGDTREQAIEAARNIDRAHERDLMRWAWAKPFSTETITSACPQLEPEAANPYRRR
jgi:hypothetical protein